jgi:hypothetical protein
MGVDRTGIGPVNPDFSDLDAQPVPGPQFSIAGIFMKKEYKHIILISCLVIFLVNVPILFFYLFPKDGLFFLGRRVINSQDLYTYLSYIEQSKQGSWLLQNLYTTEPQTGTLVRPSYVLIGKFAHIFNLTSLAAYHVARVFFSIIFCAVLYQFIKKLFDKSDERILAFFYRINIIWLGSILVSSLFSIFRSLDS